MSILKLKGSSSGYVELTAPATAGNNTITLPTTAGTVAVKDASNNVEVGTGVTIGSPSSNVFTVSTNGSERFRVTSTGQLQATSASDVRLTLGSSGTAGTNDSNHIRGDGTSLKFMNASGGVTLFENNGTERFRITNNGVTFNGDTAAANALDDYEEGTFTPSLTFGGNSTGITYSGGRQFGRYTKIGRMVYFYIFLQLTNKGSSTGDARITGLPFTSANTDSYIPMSYWVGDMSSITTLMPRISNASTEIILWQLASSTYASTTEANYTNISSVQLSGQYEV